ncbi:tetratricopeptide repeat protein 4-like isoform X3 [Mytilus californianus]|nr:tetratricopeptide repeat protein 4-like isoform X3 [Mytilus californianus]XP_052090362.1 tetratricopeptide repeat protein 4-like isoform X3 [Mytilus californianus]XP_052090363.1 tetratricopeptide repeat protein 4-like isoform X3 [Mytilus californianus]
MPKKKVWTNEERAELAKKLDAELEEYVADCIAKQKEKNEKEGEKESDLNIEDLANHPAFMTEVDWSKPLTPELEALMKLKYEDENPTAGAEAYKLDGNHEFKKKKYDIAIDNYTEGIKCRCPDKLLNAVLYTNRAAAQFHRGNYRSSLHDCIFARKFKSDHMKAILRGATCCLQLKRYDEASKWCDTGLLIENENEELLQMKYKAENLKKSLERDKRKEEAAERKERKEEEKILAVIQSKGVQLASMKTNKNTGLHPSLLTNLETQNPSGAKVHVTSDGTLNWPVLFMYPEHTMTDYVEAFNETHTFEEHLQMMFSDGFEHPQWDTDRKYTTDKLLVYFEDRENEVMYKVNQKSTLLKVLQHKRHFVHGGTPCFVVTVDGSKYQNVFKERHKIINS